MNNGRLRYKWIGILFFAGVLLIVLLYQTMINRVVTLFNVTAQTEIVSFYTRQKPISRVNLYGADIYFNGKDTVYHKFNGALELSKGVEVNIERLSKGSVYIDIEAIDAASVGKLYSGEDGTLVYTGNDHLNIEIRNVDSLLNSGLSLVVPLSGKVELGRSIDIEINGESSPVLRSGTITMTGYSKLGDDFFVAGDEELFLGDCLTFEGHDNISTDALGFAVINEDPSIHVSYRVESREAIVIKPGPKGRNTGYRISASLFDRFRYDSFFQSISLIFGVLVVVITLGDFIITLIQFKEGRNG